MTVPNDPQRRWGTQPIKHPPRPLLNTARLEHEHELRETERIAAEMRAGRLAFYERAGLTPPEAA